MRSSFFVASYLRTALTCLDHGPRALVGGFVFPLLVCHKEPQYFTVYDEGILLLAAQVLQKLLRRHSGLLPAKARLMPGERAVLKAALNDKIEGARLKIHYDRKLLPWGLPKGYERYACDLGTVAAGRESLRIANTAVPTQWPIFDLTDSRVIGVETTYSPRKAAHLARSMADVLLSNRNSIAGACTDLVLALGASLGTTAARPFLRLELESLLSGECDHFLDWVAENSPDAVIVVRCTRSLSDQPVRGALDRVRDRDLALCLDKVSDLSGLDLAEEIRAEWVKFDLNFSRAASVASDQQTKLEELVESACTRNLRPIVQGIKGKDMISLVQNLARKARLVHGSGADAKSLLSETH